MDPIFIPIIIFAAIVFVLIFVALNGIKKQNQSTVKHYGAVIGHHNAGHRYIPGQFSGQMELDMRLPFRRFKQLYPGNTWTYEEYKKMQAQSAFRRSMSSQDNKRMVR